ncbi:Lathosterol oxidase, putative [Perkinsus marinus ATCC 50983]|uniref:Lathosterol oxidase, putative n=1 Tax=Perkinsus marinus (strain ATCC 50983 / TXsc) TaxID=423536 RepID=C5LIP1_PERM5|nr:Lathosterol oxidase, putative [Perkinsus marinus ATCC 50983]EER03444.1 Lathosterol oxidase, putative [Perkinsus marinus ATCC 50983]|eukprot:XP_002771628.1 Lathosterol oxidase, putative [Perkinsus marinus ATCC 50983]
MATLVSGLGTVHHSVLWALGRDACSSAIVETREEKRHVKSHEAMPVVLPCMGFLTALWFAPTIIRRCALTIGLDLNGYGTTGNVAADAFGSFLLFLVLAEAPLPGPLVVTVAAILAIIPMHVYSILVKTMLIYVNEWTFMILVVPGIIFCTFWLGSTANYFIEYFDLSPVKGRVLQPSRRLLPGDPKFHKLIRVCALNTIVLVPLIGFGCVCLQQYRDRLGLYVDMDSERLPSKLEIAVQMIYFILVNEFLFFYGHWLFHASPFLYKKIHKVHHEYPAPNAFASLYCHPLELLIADFIPLGAGAFFLGSHCSTFLLWSIYAVLGTEGHHSGIRWPWIMWFDHQPDFHDFHHQKFNVNYGNIGFLDRIHGTDGLWQAHLAQLKAQREEKGRIPTKFLHHYCA